MQLPLTLFHFPGFRWNSGVDRAIIARNKEGVRETPPFSEAQALSECLVPFISGTTQVHTCEKMKWTMNVDPRQWSEYLSRFTIFVCWTISVYKVKEKKRSVQTNQSSFYFPKITHFEIQLVEFSKYDRRSFLKNW